ncbi:hypothetical protein [Protaetiibacter mangrovi]|uniref:Lipoprotein n=1 Tax=Protaetiibacter mangrovi TaxID=2970926 RepID=A0ABT1ZCF7_9MICO|nr:hypothetical protein [Protaetiibacter mangrovi]MCS0498388.1 hypothetical protein [Protaetiibacter mangrovi]
MPRTRFALRTVPLVAAALLALALAACTPMDSAGGGGGDAGVGDTSSEGTDGSTGGELMVLPGTGTYAIPADIPYGGYQLHGEPAEQPAGCTWAILDADGAASFEDQGAYVFITDIPEAVTFETSGCPDWEQFE